MKTFINLFYRNLLRNKAISVINILGLTIGFLSSLMILEYVYYQRSFDRHHQDSDQVCRVVYNRYQENKLMWETANSYYPTGSWLQENFSEVEDHAVVIRKYDIIISTINEAGNKVAHYVPKSYYASSAFARLFWLDPVLGSPSGLDEPNTVAILSDSVVEDIDGNRLTSEQARKYRDYSAFWVFRCVYDWLDPDEKNSIKLLVWRLGNPSKYTPPKLDDEARRGNFYKRHFGKYDFEAVARAERKEYAYDVG